MFARTRPLEVPGIGANLSGFQWIAIIFGGWMVVLLTSILPDLWYAPYSLIQDDARHHVVWLRRFADPDLFANDPTADFFLSQSPIVYRALFAPAFWLGIDAVVWHLVVLVPLTCLLATCAIFRFLTHILPTRQQQGLVTLIMCALLASTVMQGLQRNFMISIFLFAWVAYLERRVIVAGLVFLIGANLYPVAAVAAGFGVLLHLIMPLRPFAFTDRRAVITVAVAGIAGLLGLVPFMLTSSDAGPTLLLEEARKLPFMNGGRTSFFDESLWDQIFCESNLRSSFSPICIWTADGKASNPTIAVVVAAIALAWLCYRRILLGADDQSNSFARNTGKLALSWFIAGSILFAAAYILAFHLYLPDRYARLSIGLIFWFSIAVLICTVLLGLAWVAGHYLRPIQKPLPLILLAASWVLFVTNAGGGFVLVRDHEPEISSFLRTSPKDTVVAGFDGYLDSVPAHGMRSSFIALELIIPYKPDYFNLMRDRTFRLRDAFVTQNAEDLAAFAKREKISHYLVKPGELRISGLWNRSFPGLDALDGVQVPMGTSPAGTECVVAFGREVNLVDAACLGNGI